MKFKITVFTFLLTAPMANAQLKTQDMQGQSLGHAAPTNHGQLMQQLQDPAQLQQALENLNLSDEQKRQLMIQLKTVQKNMETRDSALKDFFKNEERLKNRNKKNSY